MTGTLIAPRSGAAGALDLAARERIMPGGGGREPWWWIWFSGFGTVSFLYGVISCGGRGGGPGHGRLGDRQGALQESVGLRQFPPAATARRWKAHSA